MSKIFYMKQLMKEMIENKEEEEIMNNTIILLTDEKLLTRNEYKKFEKGDLIIGDNNDPKELKRWNITEDKAAREELAKYRCNYKESGSCYSVKEYALMYCECDEDGEFVQGSDYDFAEEEK